MSKKLAPLEDKYEVIAVDGIPVVSSRKIAEMFNKEHKNVLAAIDSCGCSAEFDRLNFKPTCYKDTQGRKQRETFLPLRG